MRKPQRRNPAHWAALMCGCAALFAGRNAWASGGSEVGEQLKGVLVLLGVVGVAYVIAHLIIDRVQRRFGVVTGIEFIIIGAIVGPISGFMTVSTISSFTPAIVLGTGALGLLTGLRLDIRRFGRIDIEGARISMWVTLASVLCVVGIPLAVMWMFMDRSQVAAWIPGLMCVGAVSIVADMNPLESLRQFLLARGSSSDVAIGTGKFCSALGVIAFGVLFCLFNPGVLVVPEAATSLVWVQKLQAAPSLMWLGIHVIIGSLMGLVFGVFLRRDFEDDKLLTIVIGIVIFTSGLAYYLRLSPIFLNFILGVVLVNTNKRGHKVEQMIERAERPLYITLFFFAGTLINFGVPWWTFVAVVPYLLLRSIGRSVGGFVAARTGRMEPQPPPLGRVLLAPGALSVAMLMDFSAVYSEQVNVDIIYAALLLAIIASEMLSYVRTKSWLIDFTDVQPEKIRRAMIGEKLEAN